MRSGHENSPKREAGALVEGILGAPPPNGKLVRRGGVVPFFSQGSVVRGLRLFLIFWLLFLPEAFFIILTSVACYATSMDG